MIWRQIELSLKSQPRGCHLVTNEILEALDSALSAIGQGMCHIFMLHTSASLTINENADPDVLYDLNQSLDHLAPEDFNYRHTCEGPDDMPAHVKSSLMGPGLSIPVKDGRLVLGTWQGIYFNEHRNHGGARKVFVSVFGI